MTFVTINLIIHLKRYVDFGHSSLAIACLKFLLLRNITLKITNNTSIFAKEDSKYIVTILTGAKYKTDKWDLMAPGEIKKDIKNLN